MAKAKTGNLGMGSGAIRRSGRAGGYGRSGYASTGRVNRSGGQLHLPSIPKFETHFNFDPGRALGDLGDTIRRSNPIDLLYDRIGNRIRNRR